MKTTPLSARFWFRNRDYLSVLSGGLLFFILFFVSEQIIGAWLGLFLSLAITLVLYRAVFNNPTIGFDCSHCGAYIASNNPWICGFKRCRNDNADGYPFVHRCEHCGAEPKAYECHHCGKPIFLSKDKDEHHYARCTRPVKDRDDLDIHALGEDVKKVGLEITLASLDKELASFNNDKKESKQAQVKEPTWEERTEQEYEIYEGRMIGARMFAAKKRAEYDVLFKDDPGGRERAELTLGEWLKDHGIIE